MSKRIFALVLSILLLMQMMPASVAVAATVEPVFVVDTVTAVPGGTVDVCIRVENNPGIASIKFKATFEDALTLTAVTYNSAIGGMYMPPPRMTSPVTLNWFNGLADSTGDWIFVTLTFAVAEDAALGTYPIAITYEADNVYNIDEDNVHFHVENGGVQVVCGHPNKTETPAKAATCTTAGNYQYYTCPDCGKILKADGVTQTTVSAETIAATGHSYKSVVTAPTCTEKGYTTHTCANCNDSYVDTYVNAKGHSYGAWYETKAPGCTTTGTQRRDCTGCDHYETQTIAATGHSYKSVVTAPTCTEKGYTTHTCANCNDSYVDTYVNAKGHSYGAWYETKAPGCTTTGTQRRDCTGCDHYETQTVAATGHSYKSVVTAPTCTEKGYTTHTCVSCNDSYVDTYTAALGHDWDAGVVIEEPTEEKEGLRKHTCSRCSDTKQSVIPTIDHVHAYDAVVTAPTCTEKGYTTHTCRCGDSYVDTYVNATGHTPGEAVRENEGEYGAHESVVYCESCHAELSRTDVAGYIPGDINGDGQVNNKDVTRLFQYVSGMEAEVVEEALDVNGDGAVDNKDVLHLFRYLSDYEVELH